MYCTIMAEFRSFVKSVNDVVRERRVYLSKCRLRLLCIQSRQINRTLEGALFAAPVVRAHKTSKLIYVHCKLY